MSTTQTTTNSREIKTAQQLWIKTPSTVSKKKIPDQKSSSWLPEGVACEDECIPQAMLSEVVSTADVAFIGTVSEIGEPGFRNRKTIFQWPGIYHDVTFDVQGYYRNEISSDGLISLKIAGGDALIPAAPGTPSSRKLMRSSEKEIRYEVGQRLFILAQKVNCTYSGKESPGSNSCMRPAYGPLGSWEIYDIPDGWRGSGWFEITSMEVPQILKQWPKK